MDKKKRLLDIIQDIQDLYPHLDRLMIDDTENPGSIMISSAEHLEEISEIYGLEVDFDDDLDGQLDLLDWDGSNDDGDKGPLQ